MSRLIIKRKAIDNEEAVFKNEDEERKRMRLSEPSIGQASDASTSEDEAQDFLAFIGTVRNNEVSKQGAESVQREASSPPSSPPTSINFVSTMTKEKPSKSKAPTANKRDLSKQTKSNQDAPKSKRQSKQPKAPKEESKVAKSPVIKAQPKPSPPKPKQVPLKLPAVKKPSVNVDITKPAAPKHFEVRDEQLEYELLRQMLASQTTAQQNNLSMQDFYYLSMLQQQQQQQQSDISQYLQLINGAGAGAGASFSDAILMQEIMRQKEQELAEIELIRRMSSLDQSSMTPEVQQLLYQQMLMSGAAQQMGGMAHGYGYSM